MRTTRGVAHRATTQRKVCSTVPLGPLYHELRIATLWSLKSARHSSKMVLPTVQFGPTQRGHKSWQPGGARDALSAYESLFGDAPANTADAAAEEQDASKETEETDESRENEEAPDVVQEQTAGEETDSELDLKVVVSVRGGIATIGVQRPSSDPHVESVADRGISGIVQEVPAVVERARARWEDVPKYPAHERPAPPPRRRGRREQGSAQASTDEEGTDQQQPEALRLF